MKVAVSIPDPIFAEAEALAKSMRASRSEIYARALHAFVGAHAPDRVTETINKVLDEAGPSGTEAFTGAAARRVLDRTEW